LDGPRSMNNPIVVVVIDDGPAILKALRRLLTTEGMSVQTFANVDQFLSVPRMRKPDCVLLDLVLPGIMGLDMLRMFSDAGLGPPCIAMTGSLDERQIEAAKAAGARACLSKPIDGSELLASINSLLAPPQAE
jgi:FixJ family two-component response regulator